MSEAKEANKTAEKVPLQCPHCQGGFEIEAMNCGIFRHAQYKTGAFVPPHATKAEMDKLIEDKQLFGCGKPFEIVNGIPKACEYK